jgi:hypothetical protein
MPSSNRETLNEIVADFRDSVDDRLPVELWWPGSDQPSCGYVSVVADRYVVLGRLFHKAWLNGFLAARFTAIEEVLPMDDADEEFVARATEAQSEALPPPLPLRAPTLEGLLSSLCVQFPMIFVEYRTGVDSSDAGGTILRVNGNIARMRLLSRQGRWMNEELELDLSLVTKVWFGSRYERVLERIGLVLDGNGRIG